MENDGKPAVPDSVQAAYETTTDYEVRLRTHALYSVAKESWSDWLLAQLPRFGVRTVLDLGCGTGGLLRQAAAVGIGERWLGIDQSEAMVQKARRLADEAGLSIEYRVGDILEAPREGSGFDLICACHMLYHVPDIYAAVRNCSQLLSESGTFIAATNSRLTMAPYFRSAWSAVEERLQIRLNPAPDSRFTLEDAAEYLLPSFDQIELRVRRDALRFPEPEPWAAYLKSGRYVEMPTEHSEEDWRREAQVIDDVVRAQFANGPLTVPKVAGVFLCRHSLSAQ